MQELSEGIQMVRAGVIRVVGYAMSAIVACVFFVSWIAAEVPGPGSLRDRLFAALFFCIFGGFSATLLLMTVPWALVVWMYRKVRLSGAVYFACAGTILMILVGCAVSSVSPKPLFVEDQTFLEGVLIALQRQGVCLALAGAIIGFGYWFLVEKNVIDEHHPRHTAL